MTYRTTKYSMKEFNAIARNSDGDFTDMYDHFLLLTTEQVDLLTEDDSARYFDLQEEAEYELASLRLEFSV